MIGQTKPDATEGFPADLLLGRLPASGGTKTLQLAQELRAAILGGRLLSGTRLPPSRVLAVELGVSRSVVVHAYADLAADGYLEARRGAGTRVRPLASSDAAPSRAPDATRLAGPPDNRPSLVRIPARVRLLGGLPDPQLFPRTTWLRHYRATLATIPDIDLGYPDPRGAEPLRCALTSYLGRVRGVLTTPEQIVVCEGATQGLMLICRVLRLAGARSIAVEEPCFGPHRDAITVSGLTPLPIAGDAHGLDPSRLVESDAAAVLVAPAHSYPTGATLDTDRRRRLIAWARETEALIIEDDYDAELRYDRTPIGSLQGHAPDHVIYLGSASKIFAPALRLGWIAAPQRHVAALQREKRLADMGSNPIDQLAFARFLERGEFARHLRRIRPIYRRRRDATIAALDELLPDAAWSGAAAGLHLYLTLPPGVDAPSLVTTAYRRGILLEHAALHWANPTNAPPALVLGYGTLPNPTPVIAALSQIIHASQSSS
jgi:GntR family transcriptional regulator/MocR family aminotransferase